MNVKNFLIGACTGIVCMALGAALCCFCCSKKCDKPMPPCPTEQQCQRPEGPQCQGPEKPGKKDKCGIMDIAKDLQLSEEQMTQLKALKEAKKEVVKAAREKFEADFSAILTDEQKAKFEAIKAQKPCENGPKPEGNGPRPEKPEKK